MDRVWALGLARTRHLPAASSSLDVDEAAGGRPPNRGYPPGVITGRDVERAALTDALARGAAVVVAGPAGVGKTTLCRDVLGSRGDHRESGALATLRWSPLLLFRRLLGEAVRDDPDLVAAQVLHLDTPILLDDLQWADDLSLAVAARLVGRLPLLVTVRTGDPGSVYAEACLAAAGFERLALGPLAAEASRRVLDDAHPGLDGERREQVLVRAGGNPLLLRELAGGREPSPTLIRALQARLAEHPEEVRVAMRRLSVLGRPAPAALLGPGADALVDAGLATRRGGDIGIHHALLAEAVVEELGSHAGELRRELAAAVGPAEGAFLLAGAGDRVGARARALAAATDADRRMHAELLVLAVACAPPGDLDPATRMAAGRSLNAIGQHDRAYDLCTVEGVADLAPLERGGMRAVAAQAAWLGGRPGPFAEQIAAAMDDLRGSRTALEVLVLAGSTFLDTRVGLDGRPALERAREAVALAEEIGAEVGFARYRLGSVLLTSGRPGWAELYRQVVRDAEATGDHALRAAALESLVLGEWIAGHIDDAVAQAEQLHRSGPEPGYEAAWLSTTAYGALLAVLAGDDRQRTIDRWAPLLRDEAMFRNRTYAQAALALAYADLGRHHEAAEVLATIAPATADPQLASVAAWVRAEAAWSAGRSDDAQAAAAAAEGLGVGDYPAAVNARLVGAHARWDRGEPVAGPPPAAVVPAWQGAPHEWHGLVAVTGGRPAEAVGHFDAAAAAWDGHDRRSQVRSAWAAGEAARLAGLDEAVRRLGDVEQLADRLQLADLAARCRRSLRALGVVRSSTRGSGVAGLTAREEEVLLRVADGLTSAAIAAELRVSRSTVDSLIRTAVRRLGASNRRTAAAQVRTWHTLGMTPEEPAP